MDSQSFDAILLLMALQENAENWEEVQSVINNDDEFADPGGRSALRAATKDNPRNKPCPTCGAKNVLTPKDVALGYQCDRCADRDEGRF